MWKHLFIHLSPLPVLPPGGPDVYGGVVAELVRAVEHAATVVSADDGEFPVLKLEIKKFWVLFSKLDNGEFPVLKLEKEPNLDLNSKLDSASPRRKKTFFKQSLHRALFSHYYFVTAAAAPFPEK